MIFKFLFKREIKMRHSVRYNYVIMGWLFLYSNWTKSYKLGELIVGVGYLYGGKRTEKVFSPSYID